MSAPAVPAPSVSAPRVVVLPTQYIHRPGGYCATLAAGGPEHAAAPLPSLLGTSAHAAAPQQPPQKPTAAANSTLHRASAPAVHPRPAAAITAETASARAPAPTLHRASAPAVQARSAAAVTAETASAHAPAPAPAMSPARQEGAGETAAYVATRGASDANASPPCIVRAAVCSQPALSAFPAPTLEPSLSSTAPPAAAAPPCVSEAIAAAPTGASAALSTGAATASASSALTTPARADASAPASATPGAADGSPVSQTMSAAEASARVERLLAAMGKATSERITLRDCLRHLVDAKACAPRLLVDFPRIDQDKTGSITAKQLEQYLSPGAEQEGQQETHQDIGEVWETLISGREEELRSDELFLDDLARHYDWAEQRLPSLVELFEEQGCSSISKAEFLARFGGAPPPRVSGAAAARSLEQEVLDNGFRFGNGITTEQIALTVEKHTTDAQRAAHGNDLGVQICRHAIFNLNWRQLDRLDASFDSQALEVQDLEAGCLKVPDAPEVPDSPAQQAAGEAAMPFASEDADVGARSAAPQHTQGSDPDRGFAIPGVGLAPTDMDAETAMKIIGAALSSRQHTSPGRFSDSAMTPDDTEASYPTPETVERSPTTAADSEQDRSQEWSCQREAPQRVELPARGQLVAQETVAVQRWHAAKSGVSVASAQRLISCCGSRPRQKAPEQKAAWDERPKPSGAFGVLGCCSKR